MQGLQFDSIIIVSVNMKADVDYIVTTRVWANPQGDIAFRKAMANTHSAWIQ
jgi:hypothetical protein